MRASFATPFLFLGSQALNPFSTPQNAPASISCADVFIVDSGLAGTSVLRDVLKVLDVVEVRGSHMSSSPEKTFRDLPGDVQHRDVVSRCPNAKFLLAIEKSAFLDISLDDSKIRAPPNFTQTPLVSGVDRSKVLEIELGGAEKHAGATWEKLCRFLGLGYSVLERKGLREFPGKMGGREELRRGLGGRFSYGYAGIREGVSM